MTSRTLFLLLMLMLWSDVFPLCSIPLVLPLIPALASGARMFSQLCFGALISFFSALLPLLLLLFPPSFPLHLFFTLANLRWRQCFDGGGGVRLSSRLNGERMRKTLNSSARFLFLSSVEFCLPLSCSWKLEDTRVMLFLFLSPVAAHRCNRQSLLHIHPIS